MRFNTSSRLCSGVVVKSFYRGPKVCQEVRSETYRNILNDRLKYSSWELRPVFGAPSSCRVKVNWDFELIMRYLINKSLGDGGRRRRSVGWPIRYACGTYPSVLRAVHFVTMTVPPRIKSCDLY